LPWNPFTFSTAATPFPFFVLATTTVGFTVVDTERASASSIASTSCPSTSIACQPKASARAA
jgi:hypothetical protein